LLVFSLLLSALCATLSPRGDDYYAEANGFADSKVVSWNLAPSAEAIISISKADACKVKPGANMNVQLEYIIQ
jgi:hypothetical protein